MGAYEKALELWRRKNITTDAELAEALNGYSIAFAYHSGKIENDSVTYHDTKEIFEHDGVTAYTGDLRTLFEIRNAKEAYEMFLTAFQAKRPLDEPFIKELQFCLTKNTYDARRWQLGERPGEYKRHDYVTGREEVGAAPEDVADEVRELLEELRDVTPEDVLTAAAYFHAKFENIHALPYASVGSILVSFDPPDESALFQHTDGLPRRVDRTSAVCRDGFHGRPAPPLLPRAAYQKAVNCKLDRHQVITEQRVTEFEESFS